MRGFKKIVEIYLNETFVYFLYLLSLTSTKVPGLSATHILRATVTAVLLLKWTEMAHTLRI
jgi:hypothetical protein